MGTKRVASAVHESYLGVLGDPALSWRHGPTLDKIEGEAEAHEYALQMAEDCGYEYVTVSAAATEGPERWLVDSGTTDDPIFKADAGPNLVAKAQPLT